MLGGVAGHGSRTKFSWKRARTGQGLHDNSDVVCKSCKLEDNFICWFAWGSQIGPDCLVGALVLECSKGWEAGEKFCLERAVCILADCREFIDEVVESLPFHRGPILGGKSNCPVKTVPVAVDFMSLAAKWFYVCSQVCIFMKLDLIFGPKGVNSRRLVSCPVSPDSFW